MQTECRVIEADIVMQMSIAEAMKSRETGKWCILEQCQLWLPLWLSGGNLLKCHLKREGKNLQKVDKLTED